MHRAHSLETVGIRPATNEDALEVAQVIVDTWRVAYAGIVPDSYLTALTDYGHSLVRQRPFGEYGPVPCAFNALDADGRIVGHVAGGSAREPIAGIDGELFALYVHPSRHGHGIGSLLAHRFARCLLRRGHAAMFAWCLTDNPWRRFYEGLGGEMLPDTRTIEIGGKDLCETGYAWRDLRFFVLATEGLKRGG